MTTTIPFNRASVEGAELDHVATAISSGHTSASGPFSARARARLQAETGAEEVLLTTSCTAALELSAMIIDPQPGDVVIVPSFTFTTTALAFVRQGARLVFCDIEPQTLGLDPVHLATLLDESARAGERVRAVVPVHYAGVACDVEGLRAALADHPDVSMVEDNAHGLFGRWQDEPLGSLGRMATLSFHETKNIVSGEGGALLLNDSADVNRARVLFDKGTNRQAFFLGQVDKYSWKDVGSSFGLSDVLAAYLWGQLECAETIQAKRRHVFETYERLLGDAASEYGLRLPVVPAGRESAYHMFYVLMPDRRVRDETLALMRNEGVQPTFHYVPLHSSDAGQKFASRSTACPVTDDVSGRLLRLPFYNTLTDTDLERVARVFVRAVSRAGA